MPRRSGGSLPKRDEKECETVLSRIGIPRRRVHGVSRDPSSPPLLADRERKRFLAFVRNDDAGGGILPPSPGRRCPEGAEARSLSGMKRNVRQSFRVSASHVAESAMFPVIRHPRLFCLTANEKDFSLSLEMTMREAAFSLLPLEGGAPKGRRLAHAIG